MMARKFFHAIPVIVCFLFTSYSFVQAQEHSLTTLILVRHAEKAVDGTKDPELSEQGKQRAVRLAEMLVNQPIAAIYTTNFKRTRLTALPLSEKLKLPIQSYEPLKEEEIKRMIQEHRGKTIVVVGHSNTTPWVANVCIGENRYADFEDSNYGTVLIVTVEEKGKNATALRIQY